MTTEYSPGRLGCDRTVLGLDRGVGYVSVGILLKLCRTLCPETYILQHVNNIPVKKRIKKVTYASIYDILEKANTIGT